ncbi:hypothetical protein HPB51_000882 [Rhipicephalus microplus]|uniref:Solute carrier organic anion transporter family member n=1 Tax=Rhipicephalus microplus TaxID=6941 RepID=A0A9J6DKV9_RHIMP|nr:hypothetical protein HPB51_000882 [Rhipicephalus microplus]
MALVAAAPSPAPALTPPEDEPCGWGPLQPSCLQPLRTPPLALAAFCSASFIQGLTVNGYVNVVLPTLEKRFQLRSVQTGTIVSMYNVGSLLFSTPVAYFGGSSHKPRIIAVGTLVMASGSMLFSLPHFLAPSYHLRPDVQDTCPNMLTAQSLCKQNGEAVLASYRYLFMLGNFLHGCGASPFYTLGVAYIDDSVPTKTSPVYLGIYFAMAILGPAVGFISGGYFLSLYTDIQKPSSEIKLNRFSKVWVGAWWIGFVIAAVLAALIAIPIFAFPKELPGSREIRASKRPEIDEFAATKLRIEKPSKFIPMVSLLLTNRTYVLLTIAGTIERLIAMPSACGGTLLGGYLIDKLDLTCANIIRMCVLASMFTWMVMGFVLFHCPNAPYAGATFTRRSWSFSRRFVLEPDAAASFFNPLLRMELKSVRLSSDPSSSRHHVSEGPERPQNRYVFGLLLTEQKKNIQSVTLATSSSSPPSSIFNLFSTLVNEPAHEVYVEGSVDGDVPRSPLHSVGHMARHVNYLPLYAILATAMSQMLNSDKWQTWSYQAFFNRVESRQFMKLDRISLPLYTDCGCIQAKEQRAGVQAPVQAELKRCQTACDRLTIFSVGLCLVLFGTFLNSAPGLSASIRVVGDTAKPLALGLQWVSVRLFGTIMAPIIFGMIIDRSCLTWQHLCGEQRGACIIYENSSMSYNLFGVLIFVKTLSVLFFFSAWITYHPASAFENR